MQELLCTVYSSLVGADNSSQDICHDVSFFSDGSGIRSAISCQNRSALPLRKRVNVAGKT